jgi:hypothetical protein
MAEVAKTVTKKEIAETKKLIAANHRFKAEKLAKLRAKKGDAAEPAKKAKAKDGT